MLTRTAERFDQRLRSVLARLHSVLDLAPLGKENEDWLTLPYYQWAPWPVALHPLDPDLMAIGLLDRPVTWKRGKAPPRFDKADAAKRTPRMPLLRYSPDGRYLVTSSSQALMFFVV